LGAGLLLVGSRQWLGGGVKAPARSSPRSGCRSVSWRGSRCNEQTSLVSSGIVATLGWFLVGYVIFQGGGFTKRT